MSPNTRCSALAWPPPRPGQPEATLCCLSPQEPPLWGWEPMGARSSVDPGNWEPRPSALWDPELESREAAESRHALEKQPVGTFAAPRSLQSACSRSGRRNTLRARPRARHENGSAFSPAAERRSRTLVLHFGVGRRGGYKGGRFPRPLAQASGARHGNQEKFSGGKVLGREP